MNDKKGIKVLILSLTFSGLLSTTSGIVLNSMNIKPTKNKINVKVVEKQVSRIKTNIPVLKDLEVEINEPISVDVKEYISNLDDIDQKILREFKLDTSLVNLTQPGKYTYTITYDNKKYTGNVIVKEAQTVKLQIKSLKLKLNEEIPTEVSKYVDTELTPEMLQAIKLDTSKVNNKVAGDYQYTITYENQLYTGIINVYEEQPSQVINTIKYKIKYICGSKSKTTPEIIVQTKEKSIVLDKKDLVFPETFNGCKNEIDETKTKYTFPITITTDTKDPIIINYKELPSTTVTTEENNTN